MAAALRDCSVVVVEMAFSGLVKLAVLDHDCGGPLARGFGRGCWRNWFLRLSGPTGCRSRGEPFCVGGGVAQARCAWGF